MFALVVVLVGRACAMRVGGGVVAAGRARSGVACAVTAWMVCHCCESMVVELWCAVEVCD